MPFVVFYWYPVGMDADTETGKTLSWGFNLLEGYVWHQTDAAHPERFAAQLRQYGVRYLVSNGWKDGFSPLIGVAREAGVVCGLRIDSVIWGRSSLEMWIRRKVLGYAYRGFRHFFSSGMVGDQYLQALGIGSEKIRRWPYCVDVDFFLPTPQRQAEAHDLAQRYGLDERPVLLAVCKWLPRENPLELLQGFVQMQEEGLQLVMIGDGEQAHEMQTLRQAHPRLSITFPGYVPYTQLPVWMALARVFVHPARYEPWGVSIHEALAAGCRLVASNRVGSAYDLILPGQNGFLYPSGDVPALCEALRGALSIPTDAVQQSRAALLSQWHYAAVSKNFEGLI
jgi:glycosyltransferase involved in cell wall biosynthesis